MKNVILDVDTGVDDALGILFAARNEDFNLLGITVRHSFRPHSTIPFC
ncbi:MAG: hypothetical protein CVU88_02610 [Firmicutes bacterium HGW-Firmicutes-13]|nr:MAG: hypothetical protein CVU88_02610 [Firmicutes bacterium HGW-Firmicutes-13]